MFKIGTRRVKEQACLSASDTNLSINVLINVTPQSPPGKGSGSRTTGFFRKSRREHIFTK